MSAQPRPHIAGADGRGACLVADRRHQSANPPLPGYDVHERSHFIRMKHPIRSPEALALVIRAVRKSAQVRQDDLAAMVGVSRQFAVDVERGKPTVQFGLVLRLLEELGITLQVDIPEDASRKLEELRAKPARRGAAGPTLAVPRTPGEPPGSQPPAVTDAPGAADGSASGSGP